MAAFSKQEQYTEITTSVTDNYISHWRYLKIKNTSGTPMFPK